MRIIHTLIVATLLLTALKLFPQLYYRIKHEALTRAHKGLPSLTEATERLSRRRNSYLDFKKSGALESNIN